MRSTHGARLKNSHHTRIITTPARAPSMPMSRVSGTASGRMNRITQITTAAATPGHSRIGFRVTEVLVCIYSDLNACKTSTWDARAAGISEATTAAPARMSAAPAIGSTPGNRMLST